MKKKIFLLPAIVILIAACSSRETKDKINKVGNKAGEAVGELMEGVRKGVGKAFDVKVEVNPVLLGKGIKLGKTTVSSDTTGTDNLLSVYFIFEKDVSDTITAKVFDAAGLEMGRTSAIVTGKKDDARFFEFHFDKHTNIDSDSRVTIE